MDTATDSTTPAVPVVSDCNSQLKFFASALSESEQEQLNGLLRKLLLALEAAVPGQRDCA